MFFHQSSKVNIWEGREHSGFPIRTVGDGDGDGEALLPGGEDDLVVEGWGKSGGVKW